MKIELRNSRVRFVKLLIGSLSFVIIGVLLVFLDSSGRQHSPGDAAAGWASIIFFGSCAVVFLKHLLDSRPRIIIDDLGIFDRTLGIGVISWTDIQGAYLRSICGNEFICLDLRNAENYLSQSSPVKRALAGTNRVWGFTSISLNLCGVAAESNDVLELIRRRIHGKS